MRQMKMSMSSRLCSVISLFALVLKLKLCLGDLVNIKHRQKSNLPSPTLIKASYAKNGSNSKSESQHRRTRERRDEDLQPLRINFYTAPLASTIAEATDPLTKARGSAIIDDVLPTIQNIWSQTLSVIPVDGGLVIPSNVCFNLYNFPDEWSDSATGLEDTDLLIFVSAFDAIGETQLCSTNAALSTLAVSAPCAIDPDNDRPVVGFANVCLNTLSATNGEVDQKAIETMVDIVSHELVHVLGINSELFKYFRNGVTGKPLTPRKKNFLGANQGFETVKARCVNGQNDLEIALPCDNTIMYQEESVRDGDDMVNRGFYEITLPTVRQVARNQFNCQLLQGARLENQPTSTDCIGSHFDERTWFTEFMSAVYDEDAAYFSPLTLALLEDSGWYKADFTFAENSPFGLGAGCDFVTGDCITNGGEIPSYSRGFFCNDMSGKWSCGPSHHYRAGCDLNEYVFPQRTYFKTNHVGPSFTHADWCPLVIDDDVDCDDPNADQLFPVEEFGKESKCVDVTVDGNSAAVCLKSYCNENDQTFDFEVDGELYSCSEDFQKLEVSAKGLTYEFDCPRLTQVCPSMFCPSMCSGKGECDWSLPKPVCKCFDETDTTTGCYDSPVNEPKECSPNAGLKVSLTKAILFIPFIASIFQFIS